VERRMLIWVSGAAGEDIIRNNYVRSSIGVLSIMGKLREIGLRCFGYDVMREKMKAKRVVMRMNIEGRRER